MSEKSDPGLGALKISQDTVAAYVTDTVLAAQGVYGFSGNLGDTLTKNLLGKENKYKGVKIDESDKGYSIDIYLVVNYGVKIPEVAWNIQKNVKSCLENIMDIDVEDINIHVQGVHKPEDEEPEGETDA